MRRTKTILLPLFLLLFSGFNFSPTIETKVYICTGKGSKRYHYDKHCRGLSRCSTPLKTITLEKAQAIGRTLCGWED